jgi:hypothetical protein
MNLEFLNNHKSMKYEINFDQIDMGKRKHACIFANKFHFSLSKLNCMMKINWIMPNVVEAIR